MRPSSSDPDSQDRLRILGIDPGLNRTGYGVIDCSGQHLTFVTTGVIRVPISALAQRLGTLFAELNALIADLKPTQAAVEKVFVNVNPQSTLLLGQARGACLCAAAHARLVVHEFSALQIKQAVTGYGRADKRQMQLMVQRLLNLASVPATDAADALAAAICCAHARPTRAQLALQDATSVPRAARARKVSSRTAWRRSAAVLSRGRSS